MRHGYRFLMAKLVMTGDNAVVVGPNLKSDIVRRYRVRSRYGISALPNRTRERGGGDLGFPRPLQNDISGQAVMYAVGAGRDNTV